MANSADFKPQFVYSEDYQFAPKDTLFGKQNYCLHNFIADDGSVSEVVRLNVLDDRAREEIIGFHFAQQYAEIHFGEKSEEPQFYMVDRDNPWDFEYVMHDSTSYNLEVTRIADEELLKAIKIENDVTTLLQKTDLRGFEIKKIDKHFPDIVPRDLLAKIQTSEDLQREFSIGDRLGKPTVFLRPTMSPNLDLEDAIRTALLKKSRKEHAGKDRTIIVLDNLTTHSKPDDFFLAADKLGDFLTRLPFKSVWLYTGYYSDDDGYNCEFSLLPIKLSKEEERFQKRNVPN